MPAERVFIALGTNLGDRAAMLRAGVATLAAWRETRGARLSDIYETKPVGPAGQAPYWNAVLELAVDEALADQPETMLERMLSAERAVGRPIESERVHWGPRELDLDLLLVGGRVMRTPGLALPHPRLHERGFVLHPLVDVAGDERHPVLGRTMAALLESLAEASGEPEPPRVARDRVMPLAASWWDTADVASPARGGSMGRADAR